MSDQGTEKWLPTGFSLSSSAITVRWVDFGDKTICEPFLAQTLKALKPSRERATDVSTLLELASHFPALEPAGVIFHVSRCGSTLLANALRCGHRTVGLSEAHSIGMFFRSDIFLNSPIPAEGWEDARKRLAGAVATLYGHYAGDRNPRLIIKCHAVSMLQIQTARLIWPDTPFVILVRDPIEVMVSNLANPGAWLRSPLTTGKIFGWTSRDVQVMTLEEYCARGLGMFCESAMRHMDGNCRVLDYSDLDAPAIHEIADFFNIDLPSAATAGLSEIFGAYSKDATGIRRFVDDHDVKQRDATPSSRDLARRWVRPSYELLRQSRRMHAGALVN